MCPLNHGMNFAIDRKEYKISPLSLLRSNLHLLLHIEDGILFLQALKRIAM